MTSLLLALAAGLLPAAAAHHGLPVNPALGEPGYPDCWQPAGGRWESPSLQRRQLPGRPPQWQWADARATLRCRQRPKDTAAQLSVGCIGGLWQPPSPPSLAEPPPSHANRRT